MPSKTSRNETNKQKTSRNESMEEIQTYVQRQEVRKSSVFHFAHSWVTFKVFAISAYPKYYCLMCILFILIMYFPSTS